MKRLLLRAWHIGMGHPRSMLAWGSAEEGATCRCGKHFTLPDLYP